MEPPKAWHRLIPSLKKNPFTKPIIQSLKKIIKQQSEYQTSRWYKRLLRKKHQPWILLIGNTNSGKTALLEAINCNHDIHTHAAGSIQWWFSEHCSIIEVPHTLLFAEQEHDRLYWRAYLEALRKITPNPIDSIYLTVDVPRLVSSPEAVTKEYIKRLCNEVRQLSQINGCIDIKVIVTHSDSILGFSEFFDSLSKQQKLAPCGYCLSDQGNNSDETRSSAATFLQTIGNRLTQLLHHEPNQQRRTRIAQFPMQLEALLPSINHITTALLQQSAVEKISVFFTSTQATYTPINLLEPSLSKDFEIITPDSTPPLVAHQDPLFITALFSGEQLPQRTRKMHQDVQAKKYTYLIGSAILISSIIILLNAYHTEKKALTKINEILSAPIESTPLAALDRLRQINTLSNDKNRPFINFGKLKKIHAASQATYEKALRIEFGLYLNQILETAIIQSSNDNASNLYDALQCYLIMTSPTVKNDRLVTQWLTQYWKKKPSITVEQFTVLKQYLKDYLLLKNIQWNSNQNIVNAARNTLSRQPLAQLAYERLKTSYFSNSTPLSSPITIKTIQSKDILIPALFAQKNFTSVYKTIIPVIARSFAKGNWVLGKTSYDNSNPKALEKKIRQLYINHYLNVWKNTLQRYTFNAPESLNDTVDQINLLLNPESPLWQGYTQAITLAIRSGASSAVNHTLSQDPFTQTLPQEPKSHTWMNALEQLKDNIIAMKNSASSQKSAYDFALSRLQSNAQAAASDPINLCLLSAQVQSPLLQNWIQQVTMGFWKYNLQQALSYIQLRFKLALEDFYNKNILNRFPFFKNAEQDTSLDQFNTFFGPNGLLEQAFQLVEPFIDTSTAKWQWKRIDGISLDQDNHIVDLFNRASIIQKIFFSHNKKQAQIVFTLTPTHLSPNATAMVLNIEGMMIRYRPGLTRSYSIKWPQYKDKFVTLRFDSSSNHHPTVTTIGDWAWLRMLNYAKIEDTGNPTKNQLTFSLNQCTGSYIMTNQYSSTTQLLQLLHQFRADSLFTT